MTAMPEMIDRYHRTSRTDLAAGKQHSTNWIVTDDIIPSYNIPKICVGQLRRN